MSHWTTLSYNRLPFKNTQKKDGDRNSSLRKNYSSNTCKKESSIVLRLMGENQWETGYLHSLNISPQHVLLITKEKTVTLQWRNLASTLNQMIQVKITCKKESHHHHRLPGKMCCDGFNSLAVVFLPTTRNLNITMKKTPDQPKLVDTVQITSHYSSEVSSS